MNVTQVHTVAPIAAPVWTGARVQARMSEAMGTLKLIGTRVGPSHSVTSWPTVIHDASEAYGYNPEVAVRPTASPGEVARLEEVERWLARWLTRAKCEATGLVPDTGYVVTLRAMGWNYARIQRARKAQWRDSRQAHPPGGNSRPSIAKIEQRGLSHVATMLNLASVPVDAETLSDSRS